MSGFIANNKIWAFNWKFQLFNFFQNFNFSTENCVKLTSNTERFSVLKDYFLEISDIDQWDILQHSKVNYNLMNLKK
jgi:hypothetical protein